MGVSTKVGAFNTGTGAINSTQDITCGFQPKAIIFWWSGLISSTDTVLFGNSKMSFGFATQTERCCVVSTDDNGSGSQAASVGNRDDACIASLTVNTTTFDGMIDIDSLVNWPSDGFRLIVDDVMPLDLRVGFIAFGGSDITDVDIHRWVEQTLGATGNLDITITGAFQPSIVFFLASDLNAAPPTASATAGFVNIGYGIDSTEQGNLTGGVDQGGASADTAAYCLDAECSSILNLTTPTTVQGRIAFVQMNSDGFRVNTIENPGQTFKYALCIKGGLWKGGTLTTVTGTSTDIAITGIGGTPKGVLIASANRTESTADTATAPMKIAFGAATSTSERHAQAMVSSNGTANMRVVEAVEHDNVYVNVTNPGSDGADGAAGALDGAMDVFSVDADGFTFRMSDGDPSGMFAWWVMVGETPAADAVPYQPWPQRGPVLAQ